MGDSDQAMSTTTQAAMHALRVWRLYNHFQLVTDNQGVAYLQTKKNLSKREARWAELLAEFDVEIVHRPGRENLADPLSRITREHAKRDESDSGDGCGNVSGLGLDPTGSGHSSRRVRGL